MSVSLNEELGLITDIFTDKTGTLTSNEMIFKACSVGICKYDKKSVNYFEEMRSSSFGEEQPNQPEETIEDVKDPVLTYMNKALVQKLNDCHKYNEYKFGNILISSQVDLLHYFWLGISVCHEVISISK
mmetsp:Transcript_2233/g.2902  ORF Transcript_2233/g.2902 Transcript_2233/m.2902 type:complete len:129 (-) Transcript_2233:550-936(-)